MNTTTKTAPPSLLQRYSAFKKRHDPFYFLSPKIQHNASLAMIAAAGICTGIIVYQDVYKTMASLCGSGDLGKIAECYAKFEESSEELDKIVEAAGGEAAFQRASEARQEVARKRWEFTKYELSRTRLAEADWGKPFTIDFASHSVLKLPDCGAGGKPGFNFQATEQSTPNLKVHYEPFNGYLLLDLLVETPGGKLAADPSTKARISVFCEGEKP
jgi:hypothetical protein